ncbi:MAG: hypothetical protein JKY00_07795 [Roseicyclus sp.]|nr:hypothetical protein [Roseicyclus sp.]
MMKQRFIPALILAAALTVSGCAGINDVSRDVGIDVLPVANSIEIHDWDVVGVEVNVPRTLTSSEANTIKPRADIVWREDPIGDRHAQVDALITAAVEPAFDAMSGSIPVIVSLDVTRFHAQTQRVRYTFGGAHEVEFVMTVRHAETGEILSGPSDIDLTFDALGGDDAVAADARGETQGVRITQRLVNWVNAEFIGPAPAPLFADAS